ncbi:MAG: glycoside hydrolase family 3 C-terminal domain-containing protein [Candidatus Acidiferrum sp.]
MAWANFRVPAVKLAQTSDLVILALGGNEQTSREAWEPNHPGDRDNLDLLGNQDDLAKAILAIGKPTVVVLQHGRPNSTNFIAEHVPAIVDGWYLGQEGGTAFADVVFGDYNPGGKLPITVPTVSRAASRLLLSEAIRQTRTARHHGIAAVCLWLGPELFDL